MGILFIKLNMKILHYTKYYKINMIENKFKYKLLVMEITQYFKKLIYFLFKLIPFYFIFKYRIKNSIT